jgi:hypothetical protein
VALPIPTLIVREMAEPGDEWSLIAGEEPFSRTMGLCIFRESALTRRTIVDELEPQEWEGFQDAAADASDESPGRLADATLTRLGRGKIPVPVLAKFRAGLVHWIAENRRLYVAVEAQALSNHTIV